MSTNIEYFTSWLPTWLRNREGRAWAAVYGGMADTAVAVAKDAVHAGNVLDAPDDALNRLGADTLIERMPDEEADSHRARIAAAWDTWVWAGTRTALATVVAQLDLGATIQTAAELNRDPWAQWWVFAPFGTPFLRRAWGAPEKWGSGVWGSDASRETVRTVRRLLRRFSNARDRGWFVTLQSSPGVWGAPRTWGAPGVWGGRNPRWRI